MSASLVLLGGCSDEVSNRHQSYFSIRPVTKQSAPPCLKSALAEFANGQALRCYYVGSVGVDAHDVTSAAVVADPATDTPAVAFVLPPQGAEQFNAMARSVGVGGQAVVVVDGVVVNAPRLDTTDFPGNGVVTGPHSDSPTAGETPQSGLNNLR